MDFEHQHHCSVVGESMFNIDLVGHMVDGIAGLLNDVTQNKTKTWKQSMRIISKKEDKKSTRTRKSVE